MHTLETLDALPDKAAVAAVAVSLGLSPNGSRAKITARILTRSGSGETLEEEPEVVTVVQDEEPEVVTTAQDEEPAQVDNPTEPECSQVDDSKSDDTPVDAATPRLTLSDRAKTVALQICKSYLGAMGVSDADVAALFDGLTRGVQPVIVKCGRTFKLELREKPFHRCDVSYDVLTTEAVCNIARRLAELQVYPRA